MSQLFHCCCSHLETKIYFYPASELGCHQRPCGQGRGLASGRAGLSPCLCHGAALSVWEKLQFLSLGWRGHSCSHLFSYRNSWSFENTTHNSRCGAQGLEVLGTSNEWASSASAWPPKNGGIQNQIPLLHALVPTAPGLVPLTLYNGNKQPACLQTHCIDTNAGQPARGRALFH